MRTTVGNLKRLIRETLMYPGYVRYVVNAIRKDYGRMPSEIDPDEPGMELVPRLIEEARKMDELIQRAMKTKADADWIHHEVLSKQHEVVADLFMKVLGYQIQHFWN
jgi:hypothetical protein